MPVVRGRLTPECGALLREALAAHMPARGSAPGDTTHAQQQADALAEVARAALVGSAESAPGTHQVVVHVDGSVLADPDAAGRSEIEEGVRVSAETSRRIACDAHVVEMTHGARGEILSVGRKTRVVSTSIRRALRERDRTCRFPSCCNRITDSHHIEHWADGGATKLDNLVLLCRHHHVMVHEGGFRVERDADGRVRFESFGGKRLREIAAPLWVDPHADIFATLASSNAGAGIRIDTETAYPRWDGEPIDYEYVTAVMRQCGDVVG